MKKILIGTFVFVSLLGQAAQANVVSDWFTATPDQARAMLKKGGLALLGIGASAAAIAKVVAMAVAPSFVISKPKLVSVEYATRIDRPIISPGRAARLFGDPAFEAEREEAGKILNNPFKFVRNYYAVLPGCNKHVVDAFISLLDGDFYRFFNRGQ